MRRSAIFTPREPSPFEPFDKVRLRKDAEIGQNEWRRSYGSIPMNGIHIVSHSNGTCVNLRLPENYKELGAPSYHEHEYDPEDGRWSDHPWGFGFYAENFELVTEVKLPEELFEL